MKSSLPDLKLILNKLQDETARRYDIPENYVEAAKQIVSKMSVSDKSHWSTKLSGILRRKQDRFVAKGSMANQMTRGILAEENILKRISKHGLTSTDGKTIYKIKDILPQALNISQQLQELATQADANALIQINDKWVPIILKVN